MPKTLTSNPCPLLVGMPQQHGTRQHAAFAWPPNKFAACVCVFLKEKGRLFSQWCMCCKCLALYGITSWALPCTPAAVFIWFT